MERVEADALGDRGAGGQRHDDAERHQPAEGAEQPGVDGAHPIGDGAPLRACDHSGNS